MKEGSTPSSSTGSLLRLHRVCLAVAFLSTISTHAWQGTPSWLSRTAAVTSSTTALTMRRKTPTNRATPVAPKTAKTKSTLDAPPSTNTPSKQQQQQPPQKSTEASILEDGHGHINPDLATNLWNWEQQHRQELHLPKLSFSTRQGLRLVDDIVTEIASTPRGQKLCDDTIRTDLVQEGVVALMDALNEYRQSPAASSSSNQQFERYARPLLETHLWRTLDRTAQPVALPEVESDVWRTIQAVKPQLQAELGGRAPTVRELAEHLGMPINTLELLIKARRQSLSVESTVEIQTPTEGDTSFEDQEQWDARENHLLKTSAEEVLVEEFQDPESDQYQYEGEDEMWIHQTQVAAPLRELIPDAGPSPDDLALSDMIRHDVGEFLTKTLMPMEVQVVRLAFGLDGGKQDMVWEEIALSLDSNHTAADPEDHAHDAVVLDRELMTAAEVKQLLKGALEKLRKQYRNKYVDTSYLEEEQDFFGEDTV